VKTLVLIFFISSQAGVAAIIWLIYKLSTLM
jgi:hypothetical protein